MEPPLVCAIVMVYAIAIENVVYAFQNAIRGFEAPPMRDSQRMPILLHLDRNQNLMLYSSRMGGENDDDGTNTTRAEQIDLEAKPQKSLASSASPTSRYSIMNDDDRTASMLLDYSIDSFLRGDYDRSFAEDAASPLPGLSPSDTVDAALRSLRDLDIPEPSHGAAVLLRFCVELGRGERWGIDKGTTNNAWKELLRGSLTPTMLARRLRASEDFGGLLDWVKLDVTEGIEQPLNDKDNIAFVNAALYFDQFSTAPQLYQIKLRKMLGGVWLIDTLQRSPSSLFQQHQSANDDVHFPSSSNATSVSKTFDPNVKQNGNKIRNERKSGRSRQELHQRDKNEGKYWGKRKQTKKEADEEL